MMARQDPQELPGLDDGQAGVGALEVQWVLSGLGVRIPVGAACGEHLARGSKKKGSALSIGSFGVWGVCTTYRLDLLTGVGPCCC